MQWDRISRGATEQEMQNTMEQKVHEDSRKDKYLVLRSNKKKKKQQQHFSVSFTSYHVVQPEKLQQRVNLSGTSEVKVHRRTSTSISDCSTASVTYLEYPEYFIKHLADVVESHSHMDVTEQSLTSLTCR